MARESFRRLSGLWAALCVGVSPLLAASPVTHTRPGIQTPAVPIHFEPNRGQFDHAVQLLTQGSGYRLALMNAGIAIRFDGEPASHEVRMRFTNGNARASWTPEAASQATTNYLIGNPAGWVTGVTQFQRARLKDLYPGIDLVFYGSNGQLEYDFIVHPGANPQAIRYRVEGAPVRLTREGDIEIGSGNHKLLHRKPRAYQMENGKSIPIPAAFRDRNAEIAFATGSYDTSRDLVIDPVLFTQSVGGNFSFLKDAIADANGNIYAVGAADSSFTPTAGHLQTQFGGGFLDAIVLKFASDGTLLWSTYLGGSDFDVAYGVGLDSSGHIVVMGQTSSTNFPMQGASLQSVNNGGADAFVALLNSDGTSLLYSTYFGGSGDETISAGSLDSQGNIVMVGSTTSRDLPTRLPVQANYGGGFADILVFKLSPDGITLKFSTYLGGNNYDYAAALAFDAADNIYIAGSTYSSDLATTPGVARATFGGNTDGVVARLNSSGSTLGFLTYLGGTDADHAAGIVATPDGSAVWVTGSTNSTDFPVSSKALQKTNAGGADAFLTKLGSQGSLVASTYLGGPADDEGDSLLLRSDGLPIFIGVLTTHAYDPAGTPPAEPGYPEFAAAAISQDVSQIPAIVPYMPDSLYYLGNSHCRGISGTSLVCGTTGFTFSNGQAGAVIGVNVANAPAPAISINPPNLRFISTPPGQTSAAQTVEIKNTGNANLIVSNVPNAAIGGGFQLSTPTTCFAAGGVTVSPGQTCTVSVTFSPTSASVSTGSITLQTNIPGTQSIFLIGQGFAPIVTIDHPVLTFSQFGSTQPAAQTVTVTNTGSDTLNVTSFQFNAANSGFGYITGCNITVVGSALGFSLTPGQSCSFTVTFFKANTGTFHGSIDLVDNASPGSHSIVLNGTAAPTPVPAITLSPSSISFPSTIVGLATARQTVTVKSTGTGPVNHFTFGIDNTAEYSWFDIDCGASALAVGASCHVALLFHPSAGHSSSGKLSVSGDVVASVGLSGAGTLKSTCLKVAGGVCVSWKTNCPDSDGDGLCDDWENSGYTAWANGKDVFVDLPAMGADPKKKDIFLQADYMKTDPSAAGPHSHKPSLGVQKLITSAFAVSPLDNGKGANLHIDCGSDCIMNPVTGATWGTLSQVRNPLPEQADLAPVNTPDMFTNFDALPTGFAASGRSLAFHHAVLIHEIAPDILNSGYSRNAPLTGFTAGASDLIIALSTFQAGRDLATAGTIMHELGHNLGLQHGGGDALNFKPNYPSIMNYDFQFGGLILAGNSGYLDYSRYLLPQLDDTQLNEFVGLATGSQLPDFGAYWWCEQPTKTLVFPPHVISHANGPVNWNCANGIEPSVKTDVLGLGNLGSFVGYNDWANLTYSGGALAGPGFTYPSYGRSNSVGDITIGQASMFPALTRVETEYPGLLALGLGGSANVTLVVSNTGTQADSYNITADSVPGWLDTSALPATVSLQPGAQAQLHISVSVPVTANIGDTQSFNIVISSPTTPATASAAMEVDVVAAPNPISLSAASWTFGAQSVGASGPAHSIVVTNTGGAALNISSIDASGDFSQTNNCGASLAIGANCVLNVSFLPTDAGLRTGSVTINDSGVGSPRVIALQGNLPIPSSQPNSAVVPDVSGLTQAAAGAAILVAGLTVGDVTSTISASVPYGEVMSESPAAGMLAEAGAAVNLTLSNGAALAIASPAALPVWTVGGPAVSATLKATGGSGSYTWSATGLPSTLTINPDSGVIAGAPNSTDGSPFSVVVTVADANLAASTATATYTLTVNATLTLGGPSALPMAALGEAYSANSIAATGGSGKYTWSATGLPNGLSIVPDTGRIVGTPLTNADSPFSVQVTAVDGNQVTTTATYTLAVNPALAISSPASLPAVILNAVYPSTTIVAGGGSGGNTWSATGLPSGLVIGRTTGTIGGKATTVTGNPFPVTVTVTDSNGVSASVTYTLTATLSACDFSRDGNTDVTDVLLIVTQALGTGTAVYDLNHSGKVDVVDAQFAINAALGLGCIVN